MDWLFLTVQQLRSPGVLELSCSHELCNQAFHVEESRSSRPYFIDSRLRFREKGTSPEFHSKFAMGWGRKPGMLGSV